MSETGFSGGRAVSTHTGQDSTTSHESWQVPSRVLLVQCCHLPQFFYLAQQLRERNPEWELSALVSDRPQVHFYLNLFPPFDHLFFFDSQLPEFPVAFDQVLLPLLNRGYLRIKRASRQLPWPAYEVD